MIKALIFLLILFPSISFAKDNNFYLKLNVAASKMHSIKEFNQKSKISPLCGMAFGYSINNIYRAEIMVDALNSHFYDEFTNYEDVVSANNIIVGAKTIKLKSSHRSIMFNNYINIITKDNYKIFVGAGIGVVRLKDKVTYLTSGNYFIDDKIYTFPLIVDHVVSKPTTNFAHSFTVGTIIDLKSNIGLELSYSWKEFGKVKYRIQDKEKLLKRNRYNGHHFSAGIRFDL